MGSKTNKFIWEDFGSFWNHGFNYLPSIIHQITNIERFDPNYNKILGLQAMIIIIFCCTHYIIDKILENKLIDEKDKEKFIDKWYASWNTLFPHKEHIIEYDKSKPYEENLIEPIYLFVFDKNRHFSAYLFIFCALMGCEGLVLTGLSMLKKHIKSHNNH